MFVHIKNQPDMMRHGHSDVVHVLFERVPSTCCNRKLVAMAALRRWAAPFISAGLRLQPRMFSASPTVLPSPSPDLRDDVHMTSNCIRRMKELCANDASSGRKMLRLCVETGGCSGFQYAFSLDDKKNEDDRIFETEGVKLVVDNISYDFVKGATVDYVEELIRSAFLVAENPSAVGGCSCKSSFMVKQ